MVQLVQHVLLGNALRGALLFAAVMLAMPLLRRAASATRRLVLAFGLAAALALPALSAGLPAWRVPAPSLALPVSGKNVAEPMARPGGELAPAPSPSTRASAAASPLPVLDVAALVTSVWAVGALLLVARLAASLLRARAMARRATPAAGWEAARARVERLTGLPVEIRATPELDAPAVFGVLSPVVLVPLTSAAWDEQRRHHVLLHEIAHVRRRDGLAHVIAELAVALHWFDPLAWLCARRLRLERELAADDAALELGARPSSYAEDLLAVAGAFPAPAGALGMSEPARLSTRVRAVLERGRNRASLGPARTAAVVASASSVALVLACTAPTETAGRSPASAGVLPADAPTAAATGDSSIVPTLQAIADEELDRTLHDWSASSGAVLILDPATGRVLADAGRDRGVKADVARLHASPPGSTMKLVVLAAALEAGVVSATDSIDCEQGSWAYGGHRIHDGRENGVLSLPQAVAVSSNVAAVKLFDRVGGERFGRELRALHFGAAPGTIPERVDDHSFAGALAVIGEGVSATPLQVAAAYVAVANGGRYVEPSFSTAASPRPETVMKPETAHAVLTMLDEVVNGEAGTGKLARVAGARVAGKTGTAVWDVGDGTEQVYPSFVGIVPEEAPRFVILVGVEQPKDDGNGVGGWNVAAPAFARVATRALAVPTR